jgi:nocturnin
MSSFGGFDQIEDVDAVMDFWGYRCWRLLEEILLDPESLPDVLCVQECDHYNDFFAPALQLFGFEGIYSPKVDSPSCSFGYHSDGVAVFWRTQTFRMLSPPVLSGHGEQIKPKTAFAIVSLEHILSGKIITVATCHLKSKMSVENEATRHQQITRILQAIEDASSRFISSPNFSLGDSSANRILLIGDFNTTPPQLSSTEASILTVVPHVEAWKGGELKSAYPYNFVDGSPLYSTWKTRSNQEKKQLIDYIWYSHTHFKVISYLLPPMGEDIVNSQSKLPDTRYPSDHVSLSCWLEML